MITVNLRRNCSSEAARQLILLEPTLHFEERLEIDTRGWWRTAARTGEMHASEGRLSRVPSFP